MGWGTWEGTWPAKAATTALLATLMLLVALAPTAHAEGTADAMYRPGTVDVIKLTLPPASVKKLEEEPEAEYVEGTFSLAETEGTPSTVKSFSTPITVGIRLKGSSGSLRNYHEKAAFKLKMNFVKGQKFLGLKKMTLNNMVQDPSMVHETMAYETFHANRVPSTDTGFAYLYVNGENYGLHLNVETMDVVALEKRFGKFHEPPQHLYEGEYGSDVTPAADGSFEVDEGEEGDRSDLEALVTAVAGNDPTDFSDRVAPYADLQEMVHDWAVEKYIGHWDGYGGEAGPSRPNNYYLYSSDTGVFQMLPWGTDQTWSRRLDFGAPAGVLFNDCLADPSCETMYRRALRELLASLPGLGLDSLATRTATLIEPWQALEEAPRKPQSAAEIHSAVEATRSFAAARPAELEAFLDGGPAEATATRIGLTLDPASLPEGGGQGTATIHLQAAGGEPVFGDDLALTADDPGIHFGPVTDEGEGIYTATFEGEAAAEQVTVTATDTGAAGVTGTAALTQVGGTPPPSNEVPGTKAGPETPSPQPTLTPAPPSVAPAPPLVSFTSRPKARTGERRPTFAFASEVAGSTFECKMGGDAFRPCHSPVRLARLSRGHHCFSVVAIGPEGTRGPAAHYEFAVSIRRRTRVPVGEVSIATSSHN